MRISKLISTILEMDSSPLLRLLVDLAFKIDLLQELSLYSLDHETLLQDLLIIKILTNLDNMRDTSKMKA